MDFEFTPKADYIQTGMQEIKRVSPKPPVKETVTQAKPIIKFLDLFWFFTPDPIKGIEEKQRLDLLIFSLNLVHGNLRINGYNNGRQYLHKQALFIPNASETVHASIYPTSLFYIRHLRNGDTYKPIEQLRTCYNPESESWQDELSLPVFQKQNDMIRMGITQGQDTYLYLFKNQQINMLNHAIDYILSDGFTLVGRNK